MVCHWNSYNIQVYRLTIIDCADSAEHVEYYLGNSLILHDLKYYVSEK